LFFYTLYQQFQVLLPKQSAFLIFYKNNTFSDAALSALFVQNYLRTIYNNHSTGSGRLSCCLYHFLLFDPPDFSFFPAEPSVLSFSYVILLISYSFFPFFQAILRVLQHLLSAV